MQQKEINNIKINQWIYAQSNILIHSKDTQIFYVFPKDLFVGFIPLNYFENNTFSANSCDLVADIKKVSALWLDRKSVV